MTSIQVISISTALLGAGGIASLTFFSIPSLQALPASRSLPQVRWLFSRGSHVYPTVSMVSSIGFLSTAYASLATATDQSLLQLVRNVASGKGGFRVNALLAAAALCFSIAPFTAIAMIPTNFALIQMNEDLGGARSAAAAKEGAAGGGTAEQSVDGKGQINQFTDVSGPQGKSERESSKEEDRRARELLGKFGRLNLARALLMGTGGVVGLVAALS